MSKRQLKMPDGSKFDLAVPEGFGSAVLAMNDAGAKPPLMNARRWQYLSLALAVASALVALKALTTKQA